MIEVDEVLAEFLSESRENLEQLDNHFVAIERDGDPKERRDRLAAIFRTIHTIKGTCGFLSFERLERITHRGEALLALLRDGKLELTREIIDGLLALVDMVRGIMASIEQGRGEGADPEADARLLARLTGLMSGTPAPAVEAPAAPPVDAPAAAAPPDDAPAAAAPPVDAPAAAAPPVDAPAAAAPPVDAPAAAAAPAPPRAEAPAAGAAPAADQSLRVDVRLLDRLMNQMGELVLARNQILQLQVISGDATLAAATQRLDLITSELQAGVMKLRMQPIGRLWSQLPRVVRDLSRQVGKEVRLELEGEDTELDRTLLDAIKDPLTHMVRNAVDHGLERPDVREARGKAREGRLRLRAYHQGGHVNIEIIDDGAGIDARRVANKAVERGLISAAEAARLAEEDAVRLIFLPGFSTAEQVTAISGRGVGMDVVREHVERFGGSVGIRTRLGEGTTLHVRLPLTLAIVPALMVSCAGQRFALPQQSLHEVVRIDGSGAEDGVERLHSAPVYRLRGRLLPVVHLDQVLGLRTGALVPSGPVTLMVLHAEGRRFGVVVDGVTDAEEIVVKPLSHVLRAQGVFAGATILGDGEVALILDVAGLARRGDVVRERRSAAAEATPAPVSNGGATPRRLLVLRSPDDGRVAIPLERVLRLQEVSRAAIEEVAGHPVLQYRGEILRMVDLATVLPERRRGHRNTEEVDTDPDRAHVVICATATGLLGVVVEGVVDATEVSGGPQAAGSRRGVLGVMVVDGRVTELLDVDVLARDRLAAVGGELASPMMEL